MSGEVPEAVTENVAVWPAVMAWLEGCVVIEGATGGGFTVSTALLLVALPTELLTTTPNSEPLSEVVSAVVV